MRPRLHPCLHQMVMSLVALGCLGLGVDARAQTQPSHEGEQVFKARCVVCHGANADGQSALAKIMQPPPANLRTSKLSDDERSTIVRKGGAAVGRSPNMPIWEQELNEQELRAVLSYVRSIKGSSP